MIVVPVDKIAGRCRRVTQRTRQRSALGNKPTQARTLCSISRYTEVLFATKVELLTESGCSDAQGRWYRNKKPEDEKAE